jgi:hypothetical protein
MGGEEVISLEFNFRRAHAVNGILRVNGTHVWIFSAAAGVISVPKAGLQFLVTANCTSRCILFDTDEPIRKREKGEDHATVPIHVSHALLVAEEVWRLVKFLETHNYPVPEEFHEQVASR